MRNFKRFLSLVLAVVMVAGMAVFAAPASSAAASSAAGYASSVEFLADLGVMKGYGDGNYGENDDVTRYQMALFFVRSIFPGWNAEDENPTQASEVFTDVKGYGAAIDAMAGLGIVNGVGDNLFAPESNILYRDAIVMAVRAIGITAAEQATLTYPWGYIVKANALGLTDGISGVSYSENLKRGDVARIIENVLKCPLDKDNNTYLNKVLNATDIGSYQLVATNNIAINGNTILNTKSSQKGWVTLENAKGEEISVKVSNLKLEEGFDVNTAVSFNFAVTKIGTTNPVYYATMYDVVEVENFGDKNVYDVDSDDAVVTYNDDDYAITAFLTYNTGSDKAANKAYASAAASDLDKWGKLYFQKDANGELQPAFYVPYHTMTTIYTIGSVKLTNSYTAGGYTDTQLKNKTAPIYVMPTKNHYEYVTETTSTVSGFVHRMAVKGINGEAIGYIGVDGAFYKSDSGTSKFTSTDSGVKFFGNSPDYGVTVVGDLKSGSIFLGNVFSVGDYSFVTVAKNIERTYEVGKFEYVENGKDMIVDGAAVSVGAAIPDVVADNYGLAKKVAQIDATLIGKDIVMTKLNGKVVGAVTSDGTNPTTDDKHTAKYFVIKGYEKNIVNNGDGTLSMSFYNAAENKFETITVTTINGTSVASLATTFGLGTLKQVTGATGDTFAAVVANMIESATTYDVHVNENIDGTPYGVTYALLSYTEADGKYALSTDLTWVAPVNSPRIEAKNMTFTKYNTSSLAAPQYIVKTWDGVNNKISDNVTKKYLSVSAATRYVAIGSDGMTVYTDKLATDTDTLNLATQGTIIFELSNDLVYVMNVNKTCNEVIGIANASTSTTVNTGAYYVLGPKAALVKTERNAAGQYVYTIANLVNVNKLVLTSDVNAAYETVQAVSDTYYGSNSAALEGLFPAAHGENKFYGAGSNKKSKTSHTPYYISETGVVDDRTFAHWAVENGWRIGKLAAGSIVYGDKNTLVIDAWKVSDTTNWTWSDDTNDVTVVMDYSAIVLNSSDANSTSTYEITSQVGGLKNDNYVTKALTNADNGGADAEAIFFKLDEANGTAQVLIAIGDSFSATNVGTYDLKGDVNEKN